MTYKNRFRTTLIYVANVLLTWPSIHLNFMENQLKLRLSTNDEPRLSLIRKLKLDPNKRRSQINAYMLNFNQINLPGFSSGKKGVHIFVPFIYFLPYLVNSRSTAHLQYHNFVSLSVEII